MKEGGNKSAIVIGSKRSSGTWNGVLACYPLSN